MKLEYGNSYLVKCNDFQDFVKDARKVPECDKDHWLLNPGHGEPLMSVIKVQEEIIVLLGTAIHGSAIGWNAINSSTSKDGCIVYNPIDKARQRVFELINAVLDGDKVKFKTNEYGVSTIIDDIVLQIKDVIEYGNNNSSYILKSEENEIRKEVLQQIIKDAQKELDEIEDS